MRRGIKTNVWRRVNANKKRAADVMEQEERDREAIRALNKKSNEQAGEDVVAQMCASVIRVQRVG